MAESKFEELKAGVIRTDFNGFTHCEDYNGKGFYRIRILLGRQHIYVQMNPEQSSFLPWLKNHGMSKEA